MSDVNFDKYPSCLSWQVLSVQGVSVPGGICPWGKCPGGTCPGGGLCPRTISNNKNTTLGHRFLFPSNM